MAILGKAINVLALLEEDMAANLVEDTDRDSIEEMRPEVSGCDCSYGSNCVVCCFAPSSACT